MKARTKTLITIISFICLPIILAAVLCVFAFAVPPQYSDTYLGEMKYKMERLDGTSGKRIVVIGGSGVAFGQDSGLIEKYLPEYSVVNFGLYADLGTKIMLDVARDKIRAGDIVIISPEQDTQTLSLFFSGETFWQAADGNFSMLSHLKGDDIGSAIGAMPEFSARKAYYALNCSPEPDDIYKRASFNCYGDIKSGLRPYNMLNGGYDINRPVSYENSTMSGDFLQYLNDFAADISGEGASVYYRLCPTNRAAIEDESKIYTFYDYLVKTLNFGVLGNPEKSVFDSGYFYDSNFHLNDSGVIVNTKNLIRDIKTELKDTSPTDIDLPPAPVPPTADIEGDDSDAGMFLYEEDGDGYCVVGVNEDGLTRTKLTLPTKYDGRRVTKFTSTAFSRAIMLEELVLQENISMIEDGSFNGCVSLRRLVLLHSSPNKCVAGDGLFGSASFSIHVPRKLVSSYRVSYFWAQFGNKIFPIRGHDND